ncbi:M20 metallopeptidase family protein [Dendrosporobacter sp. 1207_IL3150]|uniref:M20 metallopeptidase family protein n=1 Tax=Dendrosporobacter sp. 1207_IL3150 TaxID=3084054 RepID=UPI002FD934C4
MWECPAELEQMIIKMRRDFHRYPELSGQEERTAAVITDFLQSLGIEVYRCNDNYGVCGIIRGSKKGPVIALRADMDALPITEENDVEYKSLNSGIMHACGHDGHMAILLGTAAMLAENCSNLSGTIKLVFQPAEEASPKGGATTIMQDGILDDVDAIFGLHLWPELPAGHIGIKTGALMAASDRFAVTIKGRGAHAAYPHQGIDAITIAADTIQGFSHIISRRIDPVEAATLSIGTIKGGERYNVIAQQVCFEGTIRTLSEKVRHEIPKYMESILGGLTQAQGSKYIFDYKPGYPVLNNYSIPVGIVNNAATAVIGDKSIHSNIKPTLGAEDFANYLVKIPGAFFWLGCAKHDLHPQVLHNSRFDIDEAALLTGAKLMYQIALEAVEYCYFGGDKCNPQDKIN